MEKEILKDWLITIPARLQSQRLPEKPLQNLAGKPLIVRTYENIKNLEKLGAKIIVATDHNKIEETCDKYKVPCEITMESHPSGSDRSLEVASRHHKPFIMNVQGDEPFINTDDLIKLAKNLEETKSPMATLVYKSSDRQAFLDPHVVKAVANKKSQALYFSRSPIPYESHEVMEREDFFFLHHLGIYAYKKEALESFCTYPRGHLEKLESLEQLRALENNMTIQLVHASEHSLGIDTPSDLEKACALC